jgi:hypothetical protein
MTNSQSSKRVPFFALLITGLVFLASVAMAQEKPRSLVPDLNKPDAPGSSQNVPVVPSSNAVVTPGKKRVIEGRGIKGSLVVQTLGGLDAASIGTLDSTSGGLGSNMWQGASPERVLTLLKYLPVSRKSPQMQELSRRLLLTAAAVPQGLENPTELLQLRLGKLREAGLVSEAIALVNKINPSQITPDLSMTAVNLMLLQGDITKACEEVDRGKEQSKAPFWIKLEVFCNVKAGNFEKAELGVTLLDEQSQKDALFFGLFDRLAGGKSELPQTDEPITPLHFAMLREGNLPISYNKMQKSGYEFLWALAVEKSADKKERLRAAYRSLAIGSIPASLVRQLIIESAEKDDTGPVGRIASLYRQAFAEKDIAQKPIPLKSLWEEAYRDGSYFAASNLTLPMLESVPASQTDDDFELDAVRNLLEAQDIPGAQNWERIVRRAALRGTEEERNNARRRITRVDAYMLISGTPGIARWSGDSFDLGAFAETDALDKGENIGILLTVLEEFGETIPNDLWTKALNLGQVPRLSYANLVIEKNLEMAAEAGRVGETVALALTVLGEGGPSQISTTTLATVLSALKTIGMEKEARQLALEAAILRDI